jgi:hypothetical protein
MENVKNEVQCSKNLESNVYEFIPRLKSRKQSLKFKQDQSKLTRLLFIDSMPKADGGFDTAEHT